MNIGTALAHSARSLLSARPLLLSMVTAIAVGVGSNAAVHGFVRGLLASDQARDAPSAIARVAFLLSAAAVAVLLVACATVACSLLARASTHAKETAIRAALGADRRALMKQCAADGALISLAGGAAGTLLAFWTVAAVPAFFFEPDAEELLFVPDRRATLAIAATCLATTMACSLIPLLEIRHGDPARVLQRESLGSSRTSRRLRVLLVVVQTACCCVLVIAASLAMTSFRRAVRTGAGHRTDAPLLVTLQAGPRATRAELSADGLRYLDAVERAARMMPGVTATAWIARPPGSRPALQSFKIEQAQPALRDVVLDVQQFTAASLATVVVPPLDGRIFGGNDTPDTCRVAIVNAHAANGVFDDNAVGQSIEDPAGRLVQIVGVVATRHQPKMADRPSIYYYPQQTEPPGRRIGPALFRARQQTPITRVMLDANIVSPAYFDALGLQRTSGAFFAGSARSGECRVAVVDEAASDLYFNGQAVGGAVIDDEGRRSTIVGVVQSSLLRYWQRPVTPAIYFPSWQDFTPRMTLFVATPQASRAMLRSVAAQLAAVPGGTGDLKVTTLDTHLTRMALAPERISAFLVTAAAGMVCVLGTLGVYGVMAESTRQRRREMALRIALGAERSHILWQVLAEGFRLGMAGAAAGTAVALLAAPWLLEGARSAVFSDPAPWLSGSLALLAIVTIAGLLPARRALSVDPVASLRE